MISISFSRRSASLEELIAAFRRNDTEKVKRTSSLGVVIMRFFRRMATLLDSITSLSHTLMSLGE